MEEFYLPPSPYTEDILQDIFDEFNIPEDKQAGVQSRLDNAYSRWYFSVQDENRASPTSDTPDLLRQLIKLSEKIRKNIGKMPPDLWDTLCSDFSGRIPNWITTEVKSDELQGHLLVVPSEFRPNSRLAISLSEIDAVLDGLGDVCSEMDAIMAVYRKPGKKADFKLKYWIRDAANLWVGGLGKDFTRDVHSSGEPISEAARFCVKAYSVLDPETPNSLVLHEMKKFISEMRKYRQEQKTEISE